MDVQYRDKKLTPEERVKTIEEIDKLISQYAASIPIYHEEKMKSKEGNVPIKPHHYWKPSIPPESSLSW